MRQQFRPGCNISSLCDIGLRLERVRLRSRESVQVHARRQGHHASAEEGSRMAKGHLKRIASVDCRAGPVGLLG